MCWSYERDGAMNATRAAVALLLHRFPGAVQHGDSGAMNVTREGKAADRSHEAAMSSITSIGEPSPICAQGVTTGASTSVDVINNVDDGTGTSNGTTQQASLFD